MSECQEVIQNAFGLKESNIRASSIASTFFSIKRCARFPQKVMEVIKKYIIGQKAGKSHKLFSFQRATLIHIQT